MHFDQIMLSLMATVLVATVFSCSPPTAQPTSSNNNSAQSLPSSTVNSRGKTPVASADKKAEAQDFTRQAGIGVALRIEDGKVFVTKVLPESPAAQSNLIKANDQVVAVAEGNEPSIDVRRTQDVSRIVELIRGPKLTVVRLTMIPEGMAETDQLVVSLIRGDIKEINRFVHSGLLPLGAKAPNFKFTRLGDAEERDLFQLAGRIVWLLSSGHLGADPASRLSTRWHHFKSNIRNGRAR